HPEPIGRARSLAGIWRDRQRLLECFRGAVEIAAHVPHDAEMVPNTVYGAVDDRPVRQVGERLVELSRGQIAVPAPAEQQGIVGIVLEPSAERLDRFLELPRA